MSRISREAVYMGVAELNALRSTCSRNHVGVAIVCDYRIIMTGYNGSPPGMPHCNHTCECIAARPYEFSVQHVEDCNLKKPCTTAIHGEQNAINRAARDGVALKDSWMFTTVSPCLYCAMSIVAAGIVGVTYQHTYRDQSGLEFLERAGISVDEYSE
jgi:dCMP deaminase